MTGVQVDGQGMERDSPDTVKWKLKSVEKHRRTLLMHSTLIAASVVLFLPALLGHFQGELTAHIQGQETLRMLLSSSGAPLL